MKESKAKEVNVTKVAKKKEKHVEDVIIVETEFHMDFYVDINGYEHLQKYIQDEFDVSIDMDQYAEASALTFDLEQEHGVVGVICIGFRDWETKKTTDKAELISLLVHEAHHAVNMLLDNRGIPISRDNDEVGSYMEGHLIETVLDQTGLVD